MRLGMLTLHTIGSKSFTKIWPGQSMKNSSLRIANLSDQNLPGMTKYDLSCLTLLFPYCLKFSIQKKDQVGVFVSTLLSFLRVFLTLFAVLGT